MGRMGSGVGGVEMWRMWCELFECSISPEEATVLAKDPQAVETHGFPNSLEYIVDKHGQTWMSIIGNTQEDVRRLRQPSSCG